jgi:hypothetical protein
MGFLVGTIAGIYHSSPPQAKLPANISQGGWTPFPHSLTITRIRREFQCFRSKRPEKPAFVYKIFAAVADFHKRSFSPPGVLVYESHAGCAGDSANAELGSGAIAAFD